MFQQNKICVWNFQQLFWTNLKHQVNAAKFTMEFIRGWWIEKAEFCVTLKWTSRRTNCDRKSVWPSLLTGFLEVLNFFIVKLVSIDKSMSILMVYSLTVLERVSSMWQLGRYQKFLWIFIISSRGLKASNPNHLLQVYWIQRNYRGLEIGKIAWRQQTRNRIWVERGIYYCRGRK